MDRSSVPSPKPEPPVLTLEQKRGRIARLRKCIKRLETFDPQKVQKRLGVPEVLTLEEAIDKALSAAFGYGTPLYFRHNLAATLDHGPLITNAALRTIVPSPAVSPPGGHDVQEAQEARRYFSEGKERSIALLQKAISTLEDEIAAAQPVVEPAQKSKAMRKAGEVRTLQPRRWDDIDLKAAWRRVGRWWRGRN
jgi:hypothetical protein